MDLYSDVCESNTDAENNYTEFRLTKLLWTSDEVVKVTTSLGSSFFLRTSYFEKIKKEDFYERVYSSDEVADLLHAGETFAAEQKAVAYLARCEQCKLLLFRKLLKKNCSEKAINAAFSFLESKNYLSDERFARSWLKNRSIHKTEGKNRLFAELIKKGINKNIINTCLEEFFSEHSEDALLESALQKYQSKNLSEKKIYERLIRKGFSYSQIRKKLEEL
ncbi:MAG: regulatory protein RecX [Treponemataceae bacterium]